jgi:hypothetical protein
MAMDSTTGHEHRADPVGQRLDRRARALRVAHQLHDLREHAVGAERRRTVAEGARPVDRAADHAVAAPFFTGATRR